MTGQETSAQTVCERKPLSSGACARPCHSSAAGAASLARHGARCAIGSVYAPSRVHLGVRCAPLYPCSALHLFLRLTALSSFPTGPRNTQEFLQTGQFPALLTALHSSDVGQHAHPHVLLGYYEVSLPHPAHHLPNFPVYFLRPFSSVGHSSRSVCLLLCLSFPLKVCARYARLCDENSVHSFVRCMLGTQGLRHSSALIRGYYTNSKYSVHLLWCRLCYMFAFTTNLLGHLVCP